MKENKKVPKKSESSKKVFGKSKTTAADIPGSSHICKFFKEEKLLLSTEVSAQCAKLRIFLSIRFYVKSILPNKATHSQCSPKLPRSYKIKFSMFLI